MRRMHTNFVTNHALVARQATVRVRVARIAVAHARHLSWTEVLGIHLGRPCHAQMSVRRFQAADLGMGWLMNWAGSVLAGLTKPVLKPASFPASCKSVDGS